MADCAATCWESSFISSVTSINVCDAKESIHDETWDLHWVTGFEFGKKRTLHRGRGADCCVKDTEKLRKQIPCQPARDSSTIESRREKAERLAIPFFHPKSRSPSAADLILGGTRLKDSSCLLSSNDADCLICTWTAVQAEQMEAAEHHVHTGTRTDGPVN